METPFVVKFSQKLFCETCDYICSRKRDFDKHLLTSKHLNGIIENDNSEKKYTCSFCDYTCSQKGDFDKHLLCLKHLTRTGGNGNFSKNHTCSCCDYTCSRKSDFGKHLLGLKHIQKRKLELFSIICQSYIFQCKICCKKYKTRAGLWKHNKLCVEEVVNLQKDENNLQKDENNLQKDENNLKDENKLKENMNEIDQKNDIIIKLLDQNVALQNQVIELCKEKNTVINNTMNTTNNFNLNVFLNEKCKDALNIFDFINSLQLQLKDLEETGRVGYIEGISKIFIDALKGLDLHKRPIHCSDVKREIFYIKDKDIWEKEAKENIHLKKAIRLITYKNFNQLPEWEKLNPGCFDYNNKKNDEYNQLIFKSTGSSSVEQDEKNYQKIIKNVAKEITIDK